MSKTSHLPHWACVALVARCARLCTPILQKAWSNAPQSRLDVLEHAVLWAEKSAADGRFAKDGREIGRKVTELAGALTLVQRGMRRSDDLPADAAMAKLASDVATIFAKASETAYAKPDASHEYAMDGYGWALAVADGDAALTHRLSAEAESLRHIAATERWTHSTCVAWRDDWVALQPKRGWWRWK